MGFEQTLRRVQAARAISTAFACLAVILFSFVIKLRSKSRAAFQEELTEQFGNRFDKGIPTHSAYGGLALIGLALSIAWNGLSFIDLCVKKHYRFDRRVCIFVDVFVAIVLVVTGFLTFLYDAVIYIALELATSTQVKLEIAASSLLAAACLCHLAFFCYGCKDPNVAALSFEHVPMQLASPRMGGDGGLDGDYHEVRHGRSRSNTGDYKDPADLVEIDLGKKVQVVKVDPKPEPKEIEPVDPLTRLAATGRPTRISLNRSPFSLDSIKQRDPAVVAAFAHHTPPLTPPHEAKRFGLVGLPPRLATPTNEQASFMQTQANDWI